MNRLTVLLAGVFAHTLFAPALAHPPTLAECREGGEFIRHAAMSRDNGITKQVFMDRLAQDIALVQAFPPDLRWFVQDDYDVRFLTAAAERVFDEPSEPQRHEAVFVRDCLEATVWNRDR
ncbi:MAG TPA: hypothetical protein VNM24_08790 [Burkholderiales bacterium]|jgi:hypothetical protein|nr:hypothetical protein [Burkholderiales bacterium]